VAHPQTTSHHLTRDWRDPDPLPRQDEDAIHETLNAIGVKYRHRNDEVLLPSRIEEERARNAVRVCIRHFASTLSLPRSVYDRKRSVGEKRPQKRSHLQCNGHRDANIMVHLWIRNQSKFSFGYLKLTSLITELVSD
jgi:Helicase-associated putative binding domain, C-terminal